MNRRHFFGSIVGVIAAAIGVKRKAAQSNLSISSVVHVAPAEAWKVAEKSDLRLAVCGFCKPDMLGGEGPHRLQTPVKESYDNPEFLWPPV